MRCFLNIALILFFSAGLTGQTQPGSPAIDQLLNDINKDQQLDLITKSDRSDSILQIYTSQNNICGQVKARAFISAYLDGRGMSDSALAILYTGLRQYQSSCDSMVLMDLYLNLTNVFLSLGDLNRVDSISNIALRNWNLKWKPLDAKLAILTNKAIYYAMHKNSVDTATHLFRLGLREAEADQNDKYIQKALINLGTMKGIIGDLDSAYYFLHEAVALAKRSADVYDYMTLLINLSSLEKDRGRYTHAEQLLDSVNVLVKKTNNLEIEGSAQLLLAEIKAGKNQFEEAFNTLKIYLDTREAFLDEERLKVVSEMSERYQSEKKARQIQELELDNANAALENARVASARNRFMYFGIAILLLAIGIWSRLRHVRKSRAAIQKERDISDNLLLNILPKSVADELKTKGYADARQFDNIAILFSDFKGFTTLAEKLTPAQLVEEINICFKAFDAIMQCYGIEKIKTIGDAYMAAGGLNNETSGAKDVVEAALAMQDFLISRKKELEAHSKPYFEMRVGIHTGPVIAGVVGEKKFQYDLWGDTVNVASRMESNGQTGKVNISETTYEQIKNEAQFNFTMRTGIAVKGKGEMNMYFVEKVGALAYSNNI